MWKEGEEQIQEIKEREGLGHSEDDDSSPRGVLEIPITGSGSDSDISEAERGAAWEINYGTLHWRKLFGQIKRKSSMKFSTIPLLGGYGYDFSKKAFKKKLGRNHSAGDAIDCGDFEIPKPSWRNFTYQELKIATHDFTPGNPLFCFHKSSVFHALVFWK